MADLVVCLDGCGGIAACCPPVLLESTLRSHMHSTRAGVSAAGSHSLLLQRQFEFFEVLCSLPTSAQCAVAAAAASSGDLAHTEETKDQMQLAELKQLDTHMSHPEWGTGSKSLSPVEEPTAVEVTALTLDTGDNKIVIPAKEVVKLVKKEEKASGAIGLGMYWFYLNACGGAVAVVLILIGITTQPTAGLLNNYTLSVWVRGIELRRPSNMLHAALAQYLGSVLLVVTLTIFKDFYQAFSSLKAAKDLHNEMLNKVSTIPLRRTIIVVVLHSVSEHHTIDVTFHYRHYF